MQEFSSNILREDVELFQWQGLLLLHLDLAQGLRDSLQVQNNLGNVGRQQLSPQRNICKEQPLEI